MKKVAKLVTISLTTRVIVDENSTEEQIVSKAKSKFQDKLDNDELLDNLDSISNDKEMPFGTLDSDNEETKLYVLGENSINGIKLSEKIHNEDLHEYHIIHRESFINKLIGWISECISTSEKEMMRYDLETLMMWEDEYILSSNLTNDYIRQGDLDFNKTCKELLELNKGVDVYFQPDLEHIDVHREIMKGNFNSFDVFKNKENCKNIFPHAKIIKYSGNDIENPNFVDDNWTND